MGRPAWNGGSRPTVTITSFSLPSKGPFFFFRERVENTPEKLEKELECSPERLNRNKRLIAGISSRVSVDAAPRQRPVQIWPGGSNFIHHQFVKFAKLVEISTPVSSLSAVSERN